MVCVAVWCQAHAWATSRQCQDVLLAQTESASSTSVFIGMVLATAACWRVGCPGIGLLVPRMVHLVSGPWVVVGLHDDTNLLGLGRCLSVVASAVCA